MEKNIPCICLAFFSLPMTIPACTNSGQVSSTAKKPNVIIILTDDLGYGDISCYGQKNYQTPNIDNLAEHGVKCTDFYVPTPFCAPSRATILTGRFPLRHGIVSNPNPEKGGNDIGIRPNEITLGEVFQEAGYHTKCIGKWHLGHTEEYFPVNHGFDEYYGILYSNDMRPVQLIENKDTVEYPVDQNLLTQKYTEQAIDFISRHKNEPFFLHLCHAMPHKPLAASDEFYTPETPNDLYADVIRELDWSVGEIIDTLKELKILDNTIVIFMSDNGPSYGGSTGGLRGMKATVWEGGTRVPFIIRYPKVFPEDLQINTPCWSPDIFPTLLSLTDITPTKSNYLDGEDITEILLGKQHNHSPIFGFHKEIIKSVRKGDYKLFVVTPDIFKPRDSVIITGPIPDGINLIARPEQATSDQYPGLLPPLEQKNNKQLYNLAEDKTESNDLAGEHPELVKELEQSYEDFKKSMDTIKK
jgi:uncharacterized sulfatase